MALILFLFGIYFGISAAEIDKVTRFSLIEERLNEIMDVGVVDIVEVEEMESGSSPRR